MPRGHVFKVRLVSRSSLNGQDCLESRGFFICHVFRLRLFKGQVFKDSVVYRSCLQLAGLFRGHLFKVGVV